MRILLLMGLSSLISVSMGSKVDDDPTSYAPKEAAFEVRFPAAPTVEKKPNLFRTIVMANVRRKAVDELGFNCQWLLKSSASSAKEGELIYLKGSVAGAVTAARGKLLEEKAIMHGDFIGREFIVLISEGNTFRSRVFVAGKRVISLQVWGKDKDAVNSKEANAFFDSLKIAK